MKLSGPGLLFVGRFLITVSISVLARSCESCRIGQGGGALSEGPRDAPGGLRSFGADGGRGPGKHRPQQLVESPDS